MAGGIAEPESLIPGSGFQFAVWDLLCLAAGALHLSGQSAARQFAASTAGAAAGGGGVFIAGGDGTTRFHWSVVV